MTDIRKELWIDAEPATVFAYLTEPEKLVRWHCVSAKVDLRIGGAYRINVTGVSVAAGSYREISPPHRLVYSWGWEGSREVPPGASLITVELSEERGGTRLVFIHTGLNAEQAEQHVKGWNNYLGRLAVAAPGGDPGPDPFFGH